MEIHLFQSFIWDELPKSRDEQHILAGRTVFAKFDKMVFKVLHVRFRDDNLVPMLHIHTLSNNKVNMPYIDDARPVHSAEHTIWQNAMHRLHSPSNTTRHFSIARIKVTVVVCRTNVSKFPKVNNNFSFAIIDERRLLAPSTCMLHISVKFLCEPRADGHPIVPVQFT